MFRNVPSGLQPYRIIFLFTFILLCNIPLCADMPSPPPWIYGQWQAVVESENGEANILLLIFLPNDILINGTSVNDMIAKEFIVAFNQQIQDNIYSIRLEYAGGFWWEESFPMPVMTSVYTDKSCESGVYNRITYQFLPLGTVPLSPVPADFN